MAARLPRPRQLLRALGSRALEYAARLSTSERFVLLGVATLHVVAIGWGLPSSDGWDVDGIAPRDFLPGVVKTFTPHEYFTYPPLHLLLLTFLSLPITVVELGRAPSLAPADLVHTFLATDVMTAFALIARLVSFLMSLGVVLAMGSLAKSIFQAPSARAWAMAVAGVEVAGTYYAHTTNLDMPAFFWSSLALVSLVDALSSDAPKRLRRVAILAACAIATKDQAYAVFALTLPIVIAAWFFVSTKQRRLEIAREALVCAGLAIGLVLLFDGAVWNPSGFVARLHFLTGSASQDYALHSNDWPGRLSAFEDAVTFLPNHYPTAVVPLFAMGLLIAVEKRRGRGRIIALVPLLGILSFTLCFNLVARRIEERFMLPQMQLLAVYAGGLGVVSARLEGRRVARSLLLAGATLVVALGARMSATVLANMIGDARYDAERFLRENVKRGELVEVYGSNPYLPRFPSWMTVERVDEKPVKARNPMPGIIEREARPSAIDERRPLWLIVGAGHAWRYLQPERGPQNGRILAKAQQVNLDDVDTREYIRALFAGRTSYEKVYVAHYEGSALFPPHPLHGSLATDMFVFKRR